MTANMSDPATYFHKESLYIICDSFHDKMTDAPQSIVSVEMESFHRMVKK